MGSLERGGAQKVINLPVRTGKGDAPGCLRGPCGPFSAHGFGGSTYPRAPVWLFRFALCHSLWLPSWVPFFVSASDCLPVPLSLAPLSAPNLRPREF